MRAIINLQHQMIFTSVLRYCWETINVKIEKVGNSLSSGLYVVSGSQKSFSQTEEQKL